ncbi:heavy metal sensor histidine kinase [Photobacterium sp.]|uniref:heavy metal sensor histidine kinase n=1 Tax=Photobacterium sp. TaxID=660 RepID=UPI00299D2EA1|nr:heavy metal sensor histidine kinase [Photobacterium sp.]MDX1301526.1 heavy metal sensor histidine kinase [Photobacterium sp.]
MILQRSLSFRLTCFFSAASMIVLTSLGWLIYVAIDKHFIEQDRTILNDKALVVQDFVHGSKLNNDLSILSSQLGDIFEEHHILVTNVTNIDRVIYSSPNVNFPDDVTAYYLDDEQMIFEWSDNDELYRGMRFHILTELPVATEYIVTIAININHHRQFLDSFKDTLIKFIVVAGIVSGILGWFATQRGLLPLQILRKRAESVTVTHLDHRMPVDTMPIEIADLSVTLNQMLERLEGAVKRLSDFSSDIAHELRTPISNLMTQTHVSLSRPRTAREYQDILASNSEEFERLARMIADMLYLAKSDNGLLLATPKHVPVEKEVCELFEFYDALAEEKSVTLRLRGAAQIKGDRLMLRRAFGNLISNALRHSSDGGYVEIRIIPKKEVVIVEVENQGETISPEDLPHLFERFYRADKSRTHGKSDGVGLGLAITKSIVAAHGGEIAASSSGGITIFSLTLASNRKP